jgi:hypothetical protein
MTCTCPKPSLHDRILRAISIRNAEEYSDIVTAAARLLVSAHETDEGEGFERVDGDEADEYRLLVADIDNETCIPAESPDPIRSAIEVARHLGKENLAEDLEDLLAEMEEDAEEAP